MIADIYILPIVSFIRILLTGYLISDLVALILNHCQINLLTHYNWCTLTYGTVTIHTDDRKAQFKNCFYNSDNNDLSTECRVHLEFCHVTILRIRINSKFVVYSNFKKYLSFLVCNPNIRSRKLQKFFSITRMIVK